MMKDLLSSIKCSRSLREHYLRDPYRPAFHFIVPEGFHTPVDPNGAIYWRGKYHLCYIYQDDGKHYWGHISSIDLVHWRHHLPALAPDIDNGGIDVGIFSGGAFVDEKNDRVIFSYWGLTDPEKTPDGVCLAWANDDELEIWHRFDNPVIKSSKGDSGLYRGTDENGNEVIYGTADPSQIWEKDGKYYMVTGNLLALQKIGEGERREDFQGDSADLFVSNDLDEWQFLHKFYKSKRKWTEMREDCMCPDFFELSLSEKGGDLSGKYMMLFISHSIGCQYYIGDYDKENNMFIPTQHARMSYPAIDYTPPSSFDDPRLNEMRWVGGSMNEFFAPESLSDDNNRRIMWAWLIDHRPYDIYFADGGSGGDLSLPRVLWLDNEDGTLRMAPAIELKQLRYDKKDFPQVVLEDKSMVLNGFSGKQFELKIKADSITAEKIGVKICSDLSGNEETVVYYERSTNSIVLDTMKSQHINGVKGRIEKFPLKVDDSLTLRVFMDKSIIEVFANNHQAIARHIFGTDNGVNIELFTENGRANFNKIVAYKMQASNPF